MFVQTEETPNPNSIKFIFQEQILPVGTIEEFVKSETRCENAFVNELFLISGVEKVFVSGDFITVTKSELISWEVIKVQILSSIMTFFDAGKNPFSLTSQDPVVEKTFTTEIEREISELIEDRVRPAVQMDGGDISFEKFDPNDGIAYVTLRGSCSGCPSSSATLKDGILRMLQHYIPEVKDVINIGV